MWRANPDSEWDKIKGDVLDWLDAGQTVTAAEARCGVDRAQVRQWREDPEYEDSFQAARARGRRVVADELTGVLYEGARQAGQRHQFTRQLLFALKNLAPEDFNETLNLRHAGKVGFADRAEDEGRILSLLESLAAAQGVEADGDDAPAGASDKGTGA